MPAPVTDSDVLHAWFTSASEDMHKACPARVDSYDAATQTATVTPVNRTLLKDGTYEDPPTLSDVPVGVLRGGGFFVACPIAAGDHVWLIFADSSTSEWRQTGQTAEPKDARRHGMGYPLALPMVAPDASALADASATDLVIGKDGTDAQVHISSSFVSLGKGATDFVALSSKVDAAFASWMTWANTHVHAVASFGPSAIPTVIKTAEASVGATVTKAK